MTLQPIYLTLQIQMEQKEQNWIHNPIHRLGLLLRKVGQTVQPQKTKKKKSMETKATDSTAVTIDQTTSSTTIDRLSSGNHLSGVHPIDERSADADRHQDISTLLVSTTTLRVGFGKE
ncbi:hypothetical protein ACLB2K_057157 [Fragaria x ananassa]